MKTEKYRILIVDDEQEIREEIAEIFKEEFEVTTANNGEEGLKKLQAEEFDVAIVDLKMPVMDGFTMIQKADEQGHIAYAIILTGHGDREDLIKALRLQNSIKDWFDKSNLNADELLARVKQLVELNPLTEIRLFRQVNIAEELRYVR
jgi:DNA-binding response OmpR family regulator